jgi:hypothetical protein
MLIIMACMAALPAIATEPSTSAPAAETTKQSMCEVNGMVPYHGYYSAYRTWQEARQGIQERGGDPASYSKAQWKADKKAYELEVKAFRRYHQPYEDDAKKFTRIYEQGRAWRMPCVAYEKHIVVMGDPSGLHPPENADGWISENFNGMPLDPVQPLYPDLAAKQGGKIYFVLLSPPTAQSQAAAELEQGTLITDFRRFLKDLAP